MPVISRSRIRSSTESVNDLCHTRRKLASATGATIGQAIKSWATEASAPSLTLTSRNPAENARKIAQACSPRREDLQGALLLRLTTNAAVLEARPNRIVVGRLCHTARQKQRHLALCIGFPVKGGIYVHHREAARFVGVNRGQVDV